jgi:peptide/nickel transport system ATP-binding protein
MAELLLDVKNLVTEFNTENGIVKAVNDVSFHVNKGEVIGIVGESGSGKSVTSLSIMRLIPNPPGKITSGQINYYRDGNTPIDLVKVEDHQMRQFRGNEISMIFQEPMTSLNPVFTCGNQVMEALMLHQKISKQEAEQKTLDLFAQVKLPDPKRALNAYPHQLSGGQKQRVMIAMAMSCQPKILIADEPTTALDVTVQKTILELINDLSQQTGMSTIFITHDLGVIAEIADRVIVMYKGEIVEQGTVFEIFSNPKHPYTKGLLACRPPLGKRLSKLPVIADFMSEENGIITEKAADMNALVEAFVVSEEQTKKRFRIVTARQSNFTIKKYTNMVSF